MTNTPVSALTWIATIGTFLGVAAIAHAQGGLYAYPTKGQTGQQQQKDAAECHQWAVQQTGFNPSAPQSPPPSAYAQTPPPAPSSPGRGGLFGFGSGEVGQGGMVADGARGAALGVIGGAIAGDAGEGAAIGAAASAVFGGIRRQGHKQEEARWHQQQQLAAQQQQDMLNQQRQQQANAYQRAYSACLSGRGYAVQ